jgi:hypothetical protein
MSKTELDLERTEGAQSLRDLSSLQHGQEFHAKIKTTMAQTLNLYAMKVTKKVSKP